MRRARVQVRATDLLSRLGFSQEHRVLALSFDAVNEIVYLDIDGPEMPEHPYVGADPLRVLWPGPEALIQSSSAQSQPS